MLGLVLLILVALTQCLIVQTLFQYGNEDFLSELIAKACGKQDSS